MPMYEYTCEDGETIELLRPMKDADAPVEDPSGKGRRFTRKLSTFMTGGEIGGDRNAAAASRPFSGPSSGPFSGGGGCCCGPGGCGH